MTVVKVWRVKVYHATVIFFFHPAVGVDTCSGLDVYKRQLMMVSRVEAETPARHEENGRPRPYSPDNNFNN